MNRKKSNKNIYVILAAIIIIGLLLLVKFGFGNGTSGNFNTALNSDLTITKSEITETVKFYPIKVGKRNMEIMAVKASDGTIRTAFNTCQVCNGSPRAYYKQEGDAVVCQNCGNRFSMDMIEQQRGGCNPVPIYTENKSDDGTNITISKEFIEQNKDIFTDNWKTE